jgi:hypothetical protein
MQRRRHLIHRRGDDDVLVDVLVVLVVLVLVVLVLFVFVDDRRDRLDVGGLRACEV